VRLIDDKQNMVSGCFFFLVFCVCVCVCMFVWRLRKCGKAGEIAKYDLLWSF
jgi:IS4 transposase